MQLTVNSLLTTKEERNPGKVWKITDWNTQDLFAYFWHSFLFLRNNFAFKLIKVLNSHLNAVTYCFNDCELYPFKTSTS